MANFVIRRLFSTLVTAWIVVTVVFFLARITGDPVSLMVPDYATDEEIRAVEEQYGLDDPLGIQYLHFLGRVLRGDFGRSFRHMEPALQAVLRYAPATVQLALASLAIAIVFGVSLGILAAIRPRSIFDFLATLTALVGQSVPVFWQGLMMIIIFGVKLRWLPISGRGGLSHLLMPAIVLGTTRMAAFCRLTRAGMLDQLSQNYVRTARSKGLRETVVILGHTLPNAAIPLVSQIGLSFGRALAGSVITETIFAWPGIGRFALQAVYNRDFPVVQASVFLVAMGFLVINFLMDILYSWLDPQIALE